MKLFQMMEALHRWECNRYLAVKLILAGFGFTIFLSCKALKTEDDTYTIVNKVLDSAVENDSIYFYPKIISKDDYIIRTFNPKGQHYGNCKDNLKQKLFNDQEMEHYKDQDYDFERWNYAKIRNPKVFTRLELKRPESIIRYKKLTETIKDKSDLLDRKLMLWTFEHDEGMLRLSHPFYNQNRTHAIIYGSKYQHGSLLWILEKKNKTWEVVCSMQLSVY